MEYLVYKPPLKQSRVFGYQQTSVENPAPPLGPISLPHIYVVGGEGVIMLLVKMKRKRNGKMHLPFDAG